MKKTIFQDLMAIKNSWSSRIWRYFLLSVILHSLLLYIIITVPLTTPVEMNFSDPPQKSNSNRASVQPFMPKSTNSSIEHEYMEKYKDIPGSKTSTEIIRDVPRKTLYTYNNDRGSEEAASFGTVSGKIVENTSRSASPSTITEYNYQLSVPGHRIDVNSDQCIKLYEKPFQDIQKAPISGLPVRKSTVSYQKVKQFIEQKRLPPKQIVKIEELINYFDYEYPLPKNENPFSVTTELAACPWQSSNWLLHIGVQGKIEVEGDKIDNKKFVIANDVKIKVVFSPDTVRAYRLIGYGHRRPNLNTAMSPVEGEGYGELLMGQSLTTLYEIIPLPLATTDSEVSQKTSGSDVEPEKQKIAQVKITYKIPGHTQIREISQEVEKLEKEEKDKEPSDNFKFSAAVAQFGMLLLNDSESGLSSTLALLVQLAIDAVGEDRYGYRAEFIKLVEAYRQLKEKMGGK